jgi:hypothetical protein
MGLVDDLKSEYGFQEENFVVPVERRKKKSIKYVSSNATNTNPTTIMYISSNRKPRKISNSSFYARQLRELKDKKALSEFKRRERVETFKSISSGVYSVGHGAKTVGHGIKTFGVLGNKFVRKKAKSINRVGWKGIYKDSIY